MTTWCDMKCEHARFPDQAGMDGSNSCRTFQAVYCLKLKKIVPKNAKCPAEHKTDGKKT